MTSHTSVPLFWTSFAPAHPLSRALVLHGGPGAHHDYLLPQMLALAERRELIFYDQRGGGQSPDESRDPITWETHVADLGAVVREFALEPLTLVGYSWGALLAMLYATVAARTESMLPMPKHMVLINPAPSTPAYRKEMEAELTERGRSPLVRGWREELTNSGLRESDIAAYKKRLFEISVAGYFYSPERSRDLTPFRVIGRVQESVWKSVGTLDIISQLRSIELPTLIVHGRDDPIPLQSSVEVAEALQARLLVLERCGHVPYVEQPNALFQAIETFLNDYK